MDAEYFFHNSFVNYCYCVGCAISIQVFARRKNMKTETTRHSLCTSLMETPTVFGPLVFSRGDGNCSHITDGNINGFWSIGVFQNR